MEQSTIMVDGGEKFMQELKSNSALLWTATNLSWKAFRRMVTSGPNPGSLIDTLPTGTDIMGMFQLGSSLAGDIFKVRVFPDFNVTLTLNTDLEWVDGSTGTNPTYGSNALVGGKLNIIHFITINPSVIKIAVYIEN